MKHVVPLNQGSGFHQEVSVQDAGWRFLAFHVHGMTAGQTYSDSTRDQEVLLVFLSGGARVTVGGEEWSFEGRDNVFAGRPYSVYIPPGKEYTLQATSDVEVAVGFAPAEGRLAARLITPEDVKIEIRGGHNATRQISHILDPGDAEKLLCVEVYTPSGNWSSYPPHKHDVQNPPEEVDLEEIYHYRFQPHNGWALQRLYNDDRSLDELLRVGQGDTVIVREGYHPVVTAPGYDAYYLNFLAGETPSWIAKDEPDLAWVRGQWAGGEDRLKLPLE